MTTRTEALSSHGDRPRSWPVPAALIVLSAIPLAAGALRLVQLAGGPAIMPADHRFTGLPVALVIHIVGAAVFALVGALQFVPRLRRGSWHRRRRTGSRPGRPDGRRFCRLADPVLRGPARHGGPPVRVPTRLRHSHGRLPRPRVRRHPPPRRPSPPRLDDAGLR